MNSFGARSALRVGDREYTIYRLESLEKAGFSVTRMPYTLRIILETLLRHENGLVVGVEDVEAFAVLAAELA